MERSNPDIILSSLLDDDLFLHWVFEPTPELDRYWEQKITEGEYNIDHLATLKTIIKRLKVKESTLSTADKKLIWTNIHQATVTKKHIPRRYRGKRQWITAAVLMGLLAGASLYYYNQQHKIDYNSLIDKDATSRSGEISLILSDNQVVRIQNDSSNVEYDPTGKVKINKETIETTGNKKSAQLNQLIIPYGKTTSLTLSDGTKIWINSGTKLIYPSVLGKDKREIFVSGEIYLAATPQENCPFIVKTDRMDIHVKGTRFNVSAYPDEEVQSVVLVSGAVSVKGKTLGGTYDIYPNQMLSFKTGSDKVDILEVDVNNYISWTHGYLSLQGERIDRVLQKLEKYYNVSFNYEGAGFDKILVHGKLDLTGSLENALNYISITTSICYTMQNDSIATISNLSNK